MTSLGAHEDEFRALPRDIASLCEVVQGVLIHRDIAPFLYGLTLTEEQRDDGHIRPIAQMLTRIHELDSRPITTRARRRPSPAERLPSFLADALLHPALSGHSGTPAMRLWRVLQSRQVRRPLGLRVLGRRSRDGFWSTPRWTRFSARPSSSTSIPSTFRTTASSSPATRGRCAAPASLIPAAFGLTHVHLQGLWFVQGNVLRDLASLNRMEMLPWDVWGAMDMNDAALTDEKKRYSIALPR